MSCLPLDGREGRVSSSSTHPREPRTSGPVAAAADHAETEQRGSKQRQRGRLGYFCRGEVSGETGHRVGWRIQSHVHEVVLAVRQACAGRSGEVGLVRTHSIAEGGSPRRATASSYTSAKPQGEILVNVYACRQDKRDVEIGHSAGPAEWGTASAQARCAPERPRCPGPRVAVCISAGR